eukprot:572345-Lingulodinium_polyedra.AAC.1
MTAVKCLLTGKVKEHVELIAGRIKTYEHMRKDIMKYAVQKRLDKVRMATPGHSPMKLGNAERGSGDEPGQEMQ